MNGRGRNAVPPSGRGTAIIPSGCRIVIPPSEMFGIVVAVALGVSAAAVVALVVDEGMLAVVIGAFVFASGDAPVE